MIFLRLKLYSGLFVIGAVEYFIQDLPTSEIRHWLNQALAVFSIIVIEWAILSWKKIIANEVRARLRARCASRGASPADLESTHGVRQSQ
jgi:hypothetical protein